ncbi:lineage-specific thermal regulator protein [Anatilimnocola aggregata]|uniref:Lineage-specific thermal regulator protein n=1 Tax=Anatilimnocola aggregata TaxID=2528021 RepID=A0A517Y5A2_9BACT|nr:helix-turn-helix transcriptional regulator [Anatilimnocola aggregata]QDU25423.1 lineage-specific thermal regulator protein [Anatilimnocola aggregata]
MIDKFERDLLRGSLDLMILSVLAGGKKYGYLLQKQVRDASAGRIDLPAGTLYPLLHRLEEDKLIRSSWDDESGRKRKWYELTAAGQKRLKSQAQQWFDYAQCVRELLQSAAIIPKPA